jgi:hypothetical protein
MVLKVGHQPQMRQVLALRKTQHGGGAENEVRNKHIASDHPEHFRQPRQSARNATGCLQRITKVLPLVRVVHAAAQFPRQTVQVRRHLLAQPGRVNQQPLEATSDQGAHMPVDQCLAVDLQQGFGGPVGQGSHALAATGGQDHRLCGGKGGGMGHYFFEAQCRGRPRYAAYP